MIEGATFKVSNVALFFTGNLAPDNYLLPPSYAKDQEALKLFSRNRISPRRRGTKKDAFR